MSDTTEWGVRAVPLHGTADIHRQGMTATEARQWVSDAREMVPSIEWEVVFREVGPWRAGSGPTKGW